MSRIRLLGLVLVTAACGRDVVLGTDFDAGIDAQPSNNPFTPGDYALQIVDPTMSQCMGSLASMESSFTSMTRAQVGLVDGTVTFATPSDTTLSVSGAPIASGFGASQLDLTPAAEDPTIWQGWVNGSFGSGPLGTTRVSNAMAVDRATAASPAGINAGVAILYETSDQTGQCDLEFAATFTKL